MTRTRTTLILTFVGVFAMSGCRDKPICLDCEEGAAEADDNDDTPLPDLPCGGADLMTDNFNCGTCGHECQIWYDDTEYEAGSCNEGVCGPSGPIVNQIVIATFGEPARTSASPLVIPAYPTAAQGSRG
jgi:hypothetical protein